MAKIFEVFVRFFSLGWISFGGPAAHLGYFREAFVQRRGWLDDEAYARLVALSQFLPGPGSSQVGFAIGCSRAGLLGGLAAFIGFTLPSFLILVFLSISSRDLFDGDGLNHIIHGLKLLAVVVVAHATLGMYRKFCAEKPGVLLSAFTAAALLIWPGLWTQLAALVLAAVVGAVFLAAEPKKSEEEGKLRWAPLLLFAGLLVAAPFLRAGLSWVALFADFYWSGSLVFGGGHVVLPLLQSTVGDALTSDRFLFGYAAAQAIPGPMFSFAGFLGAEMNPQSVWIGALVATLGVFLPGFLLVLSFQNAWHRLATRPKVAGAAAGVNAAVVGLLIAALYTPVFLSAVTSPLAMALVVVGFLILLTYRPPMIVLVLAFAAAGTFLGNLL